MTEAKLADKIAFVRDAMRGLEHVPQGSLEEFRSDPRNLPSVLHWLQTAIQALIDIALIRLADAGLRTPRTSIDVLQILEDGRVLPAGSALRFRPLVGFRNRIVHLCDRVNDEIVYRILTEDRDDLEALLALLIDAPDS